MVVPDFMSGGLPKVSKHHVCSGLAGSSQDGVPNRQMARWQAAHKKPSII